MCIVCLTISLLEIMTELLHGKGVWALYVRAALATRYNKVSSVYCVFRKTLVEVYWLSNETLNPNQSKLSHRHRDSYLKIALLFTVSSVCSFKAAYQSLSFSFFTVSLSLSHKKLSSTPFHSERSGQSVQPLLRPLSILFRLWAQPWIKPSLIHCAQ